jgi:hypothetical protein
MNNDTSDVTTVPVATSQTQAIVPQKSYSCCACCVRSQEIARAQERIVELSRFGYINFKSDNFGRARQDWMDVQAICVQYLDLEYGDGLFRKAYYATSQKISGMEMAMMAAERIDCQFNKVSQYAKLNNISFQEALKRYLD